MTRGKLIEQIKRLISGGNPSISTYKDEEIREAINQVLNMLLKTEMFKVTLPSGETIPDGLMIATYENKAVSSWQNRSRVQLPAIPIALPKGMGVFQVCASGDPDDFYVPIPLGQSALMKTQPLINDLLGRVGYEVRDGYIIFHKDITPNNVDIYLVVSDISKYGDYELLPIPADMEASVIDTVRQMFTDKVPDKLVDSNSEPTKFGGK